MIQSKGRACQSTHESIWARNRNRGPSSSHMYSHPGGHIPGVREGSTCEVQGQLTHPQHCTAAEDSITKHRAALKAHQKLWNKYIPSISAEVSFPKAFLRTGGHSSQLLPPSGCGWLQFRCSQVASSIAAHQPRDCGCQPGECLAAHTL